MHNYYIKTSILRLEKKKNFQLKPYKMVHLHEVFQIFFENFSSILNLSTIVLLPILKFKIFSFVNEVYLKLSSFWLSSQLLQFIAQFESYFSR